MRWRIYYGCGSTYSDEDGSPFDAPADNVQAIVQIDAEHGRNITHGCDYYWWTEDEWFGQHDRFGNGLFDYLRQPGPKKVIFARTLRNEVFKAVLASAIADPDFPPKSGRAPNEEPPP